MTSPKARRRQRSARLTTAVALLVLAAALVTWGVLDNVTGLVYLAPDRADFVTMQDAFFMTVPGSGAGRAEAGGGSDRKRSCRQQGLCAIHGRLL